MGRAMILKSMGLALAPVERGFPLPEEGRRREACGYSVSRRWIVAATATLALSATTAAWASEATWTSLINFRDFSGWETWQGVPRGTYDVPGLRRSADGRYRQAIGLNRDPLKVFSYEKIDSVPVLRISGQVRGALTTLKAYGNYRLRAKFKWGDARWGADDYPRNTGILYHAFGEQGGFGAEGGLPGAYMKSIEFELQLTGMGDFIPFTGVSGMVRAVARDNPNFSPINSWRYVYSPANAKLEFADRPGAPNGRRVHRSEELGRPKGEWNTVELICFEDKAVQIINGQVAAMASDLKYQSTPGGPLLPLTKGRIQIQSEDAEVFFSSIEIMPLDSVPPEMAGL